MTLGSWKKSGYLLQSAEHGAGELLLYSQAPQGVRGEGSYGWKLGLRDACSAHVQVLGQWCLRPSFGW